MEQVYCGAIQIFSWLIVSKGHSLIMMHTCICSFVLRSVSIVDITGLSETEEVHTIGDTSYTIHDDTVLVSRESDVCSISSSESSEDENETRGVIIFYSFFIIYSNVFCL